MVALLIPASNRKCRFKHLNHQFLSKLVQALSARLLIASATILWNATLGLLRAQSGWIAAR